MSALVTEFGYFITKPGVEAWDENSVHNKALAKAATFAHSQPGAQRAYLSEELEDLHRVWIFLDWDTVDDHLKYVTTQGHNNKATLENTIDFTKGGVLHVVGEGRPLTLALSNTPSSVAQVLRAYFPSDIGPDARQAASLEVEEFMKATLGTFQDSEEAIYGWSVENDVPVIGEESKTGKVLVVFIRWSSVGASNEALESQLFQDNLGTIRNLPGLIEMDVFHVRSRLTLEGHSAGVLK